jgi:hypothetical protein
MQREVVNSKRLRRKSGFSQILLSSLDSDNLGTVKREFNCELPFEASQIEDAELIERFAGGVGYSLNEASHARVFDFATECLDTGSKTDVMSRPGTIFSDKGHHPLPDFIWQWQFPSSFSHLATARAAIVIA